MSQDDPVTEIMDAVAHNCTHCDMLFKKAYYLTRHIYREHIKPTCTICGNSFNRMKDLKEHAVNSHEVKMNKLCFMCKKAYSTKQQLENHFQTDHDQEKPLTCPKCPRIFTNENRLKTHSVVHQKKLLQCSDCTMTFSSHPRLSTHKRKVHSEILILECPKCGEGFEANKDICKRICQLHLEAEPEVAERVFNCKYCDQTFEQMRVVNNHVRKEHPEKCTFNCENCPFIFETENQVKRHVRRRHTPKKFGCELCHRRFRWERLLQRHMNMSHGNPTNEKNVMPEVVNEGDQTNLIQNDPIDVNEAQEVC